MQVDARRRLVSLQIKRFHPANPRRHFGHAPRLPITITRRVDRGFPVIYLRRALIALFRKLLYDLTRLLTTFATTIVF